MKKKVGYLLRVSTKKQVNQEEDIPMQRDACLEFIKKNGWEVYKEYLESGVSGYHKRFKDREKLQEIVEDAINHKFDILLVFMFDRLGRTDDETPFLLQNIVENGIRVFSVCEGEQVFKDATDSLMNYIRFWGAKNESAKTSKRVDSGRTYATKEGRFTGGIVPYGYMLVPTGKLDCKGRMINNFVKEPRESGIVANIYNQLVDNNLSLNGIVNYLNVDLGLITRKGNKWNTSTVRNILRNPIYKGYMSYGKTRLQEIKSNDTDAKSIQIKKEKRQRCVPSEQWILAKEQNKELIIVSEEKWQMAQDILAKRYKKYTDSLRPSADRTWKSSLLLVGLLECGYCRGMISPATASQKSVSKTGEIKRCHTDFYKCNTRGRGKELCASKSYISRNKLETVVLNEVYNFLDRIENIDCSKEIQETILNNSHSEKEELQTLEKELTKIDKAYDNMKKELHNYYSGESSLNLEFINDLLNENRQNRESMKNKIDSLKKMIDSKEVAANEYQQTIEMIPVWKEVFSNAPLNIKKQMLSILVEKIVVKGNEVDIFFKIDIDSFLNLKNNTKNGLIETNNKISKNVPYRKIISESVNVNECQL